MEKRGVKVSFNDGKITVTSNKPTKGLVFEEREGVLVNDSAVDIVPGDEQVITVRGAIKTTPIVTLHGAQVGRGWNIYIHLASARGRKSPTPDQSASISFSTLIQCAVSCNVIQVNRNYPAAMFHTFQATETNGEDTHDAAKLHRPLGARRITTSNACGAERYAAMVLHPADNVYTISKQMLVFTLSHHRVSYTKGSKLMFLRLMEDLSASVDRYRSVFERLFPGRSIEQLAPLSKDDLIAIIGIPPAKNDQSTQISELGSPISTLGSEGAESLETLIQAPEQDPVADEATLHQARVHGISDDVNGLSLSLDRPSSYVGVSSITAALKVICRVAPATRRLLALGHTETALPSRTDSPDVTSIDPAYLPPAELGQVLIETYFRKVHPLMPMLDEKHFWQTWLYGERKDHAWMALLNTVLALGSVMSSDCTDNSHDAYYQRAMQLLDLDSLGSGNLLVVQALGLLSGYYLHYVSRPNLANSLMGATLRQATVLGLHREYTDAGVDNDGHGGAYTSLTLGQSKLACPLSPNTTTGRPSLGQQDKGITVQVPYVSILIQVVMRSGPSFLPLVHNVAFCRIASQIQDVLSASPLLPFDDLNRLDKELLQWHTSLPIYLKPASSSTTENQRPQKRDTIAKILETPSMIMHWKYQNLRLLLHRPYLLATALRNGDRDLLSAEEKVGSTRCQAIAARTIEDISDVCPEDLLAGWNGVWFMYQAVMVPLVCISSSLGKSRKQVADDKQNIATTNLTTVETADEDAKHHEQVRLQERQALIEKALQFFERMDRWSVAAKKSHDVVSRLYEVSKILASDNWEHILAAQDQSARVHNPSLDIGTAVSGHIDQANDFDKTQLPFSSSDMMTKDIWGLSPNGAAAMNNFWFDDMMWDVPVADIEMFENTGNGLPGNFSNESSCACIDAVPFEDVFGVFPSTSQLPEQVVWKTNIREQFEISSPSIELQKEIISLQRKKIEVSVPLDSSRQLMRDERSGIFDPEIRDNLLVIQFSKNCSEGRLYLVQALSQNAHKIPQCGSARIHTIAGVIGLDVVRVVAVDQSTLASEHLVYEHCDSCWERVDRSRG
ncbi:hypothetical protein KCU76_g111, partial [Aureobasidium melanogenum]